MSKAFTKEDEGAGFDAVVTPARSGSGFGWLTREGAGRMQAVLASLVEKGSAPDEVERLRGILGSSRIAEGGGERIALGSKVRYAGPRGERAVLLVSPDEVGLVPGGMSIAAPVAQALLGGVAGDEVEVGDDTLTVLAVQ
jgi:hypothetical protein